ncbi:MAG TPA: hypothetical protein VN723_03705 [Rhizomicrobium sp.]|jgi:hypothetical protein|nr:hypothetical protein [Rhizomicrobium sp.]
MKVFLSAALATLIFASGAVAGDAANNLAPGKPAGVKAAQSQGVNTIAIVGLAAVAGVAVIAVSHSSHNGSGSTSTTTTTGTSP